MLQSSAQLPKDDDVVRVREYSMRQMKELLDDLFRLWNAGDYMELRDLADCRIALFTTRRGGEPSYNRKLD